MDFQPADYTTFFPDFQEKSGFAIRDSGFVVFVGSTSDNPGIHITYHLSHITSKAALFQSICRAVSGVSLSKSAYIGEYIAQKSFAAVFLSQPAHKIGIIKIIARTHRPNNIFSCVFKIFDFLIVFPFRFPDKIRGGKNYCRGRYFREKVPYFRHADTNAIPSMISRSE
jgi:hypothetical protein